MWRLLGVVPLLKFSLRATDGTWHNTGWRLAVDSPLHERRMNGV